MFASRSKQKLTSQSQVRKSPKSARCCETSSMNNNQEPEGTYLAIEDCLAGKGVTAPVSGTNFLFLLV